MAGFGFGFGQRRRKHRAIAAPATEQPPTLSPSPAWNGTPGSGFDSPPTNAVRTTAKPAARLLIPPNQFYTDELLVGVLAGANDAGSLIPRLGLEKVVVHFEGTRTDIAAPSFATFPDANGMARSYLGWWVRLRHDGRNGHGQVYFEAIPSDKSMQSRLIGPYQFSPQAQLHDFRLEVAPTSSEIVGARYRSISAALSYLASKAAQNPLVTVTEAGTYDIGSSSAYDGGEGYCTIEANVPIVIGKAGYVSDSANRLFPRYGGLHFRGANITFDMRHITSVHKQGARQVWMDGVRFTNSDPAGRGAPWRGRHRPHSWLVDERPWLTEITTEHLPDVANEANLARGCAFDNGYAAVASDTRCLVGCTATRWDPSADWLTDRDAMSVRYEGDLSPATLEMTGSGGATKRTITARFGQQVAQFDVGSREADHQANMYWVRNVVDWLNTLPGWNASVIDDTRYASALGLPGELAKPWGQIDMSAGPRTFVTTFDIRSDFYQRKRQSGLGENAVVAFNRGWLRGQSLAIDSASACVDYLFFNNVLRNAPTAGGYGDVLHSQFGRSQCAHVVVAHNSWEGLGVQFLTDDAGFGFDAYCVFSNNALPDITWADGADGDLTLRDNHLEQGASEPPGSSGTSIGGDAQSNYRDAAGGDLSPQGPLAANAKPPIVEFDIARRPRGSLAAAGAYA